MSGLCWWKRKAAARLPTAVMKYSWDFLYWLTEIGASKFNDMTVGNLSITEHFTFSSLFWFSAQPLNLFGFFTLHQRNVAIVANRVNIRLKKSPLLNGSDAKLHINMCTSEIPYWETERAPKIWYIINRNLFLKKTTNEADLDLLNIILKLDENIVYSMFKP